MTPRHFTEIIQLRFHSKTRLYFPYFSATLEDKKPTPISNSAPPPDFDSWADDFMSNKVPDKSAVVKQSIQPIKTVIFKKLDFPAKNMDFDFRITGTIGETRLRRNLKRTTRKSDKEKKKGFKDKRNWRLNEQPRKDL